jgi:hypothetical protein
MTGIFSLSYRKSATPEEGRRKKVEGRRKKVEGRRNT